MELHDSSLVEELLVSLTKVEKEANLLKGTAVPNTTAPVCIDVIWRNIKKTLTLKRCVGFNDLAGLISTLICRVSLKHRPRKKGGLCRGRYCHIVR